MTQPTSETKMVFHITRRSDWLAAQEQGSYAAPSLESEGYIHCSTKDQILPVANAFFPGQSGLVLLVLDVQLLQSEIKWEAAVGPDLDGVSASEKFPHVYGPINLEAVVRTIKFDPDENGRFTLALPPEVKGKQPPTGH